MSVSSRANARKVGRGTRNASDAGDRHLDEHRSCSADTHKGLNGRTDSVEHAGCVCGWMDQRQREVVKEGGK